MIEIKIKRGLWVLIFSLLVVPVWADNPITRGTPLQMTNIILDLVGRGTNFGSGSGTVTQVNTGYGLTGGPITTSGTIAADSNVLGTVIRVDSAAGILGGPITRSGTLYVDTNNLPFPFPAAGSNLVAVTNGRTVTLHASPERIIWNYNQTMFYPQETELDTNITILAFTATNEMLLRLDYSYQWIYRYGIPFGYDGRYLFGARWTDPAGGARDELFIDGLGNMDWTDSVSNYSKSASTVLALRDGATLTLTNRMIISSVGDGTGPEGGGTGTNVFQVSLTRLKP